MSEAEPTVTEREYVKSNKLTQWEGKTGSILRNMDASRYPNKAQGEKSSEGVKMKW